MITHQEKEKEQTHNYLFTVSLIIIVVMMLFMFTVIVSSVSEGVGTQELTVSLGSSQARLNRGEMAAPLAFTDDVSAAPLELWLITAVILIFFSALGYVLLQRSTD